MAKPKKKPSFVVELVPDDSTPEERADFARLIKELFRKMLDEELDKIRAERRAAPGKGTGTA